jgi:phospholipid transport system transporter-binding protein
VSTPSLVDAGGGRFALAGALEFDTVTRLLEAGAKAFAPHPAVEVDMAGVTRCDSAAVALLLEWVRLTEARGARIAFRNLPRSVHAIASISDVEDLLPTAQ